jgi:putative hydrolase of the HAD superfamily
MNLRAVFFDMGGTIETFGYTHELRLKATAGIQQMLIRAGIDLGLSDESLLSVILAGLQQYKDFCLVSRIEYSSSRVWREYILRGYSYDPALLESIAEDLMLYIETHYYQREMRPGVPLVLEAIRQMGLKIGLISNVNSRGQVALNLTQYGICSYFDPIILSSEYGWRKPDPAIFHYAARLMNVPASACAYIGDRIARDIVGAQKAGFRLAVQIQHDFDHGEEDTGATPDAIIDDMTDLLDILQAELRRSTPEPSGPIRAILFDAGDILYYRPARGARIIKFLQELGLDAGEDHFTEMKALSHQAYCGGISPDELKMAYLRLFGIEDPALMERGKQVLDEEESAVEFFEGVRETLLALKEQGYLLGIITDTANSIHTKLGWFARGGFAHVWDTIISSMEIGVCKPDPVIYQAALSQLGVTAGETAFVGHKVSELDGAQAVGMKTIAFNQEKDARADYYIETFAGLLNVPIITSSGSTG